MDIWVWIIIGAVLLLYFGGSYMLYSRIFRINRSKTYKVVDQTEEFFKDSYAWFQKIPKDEVKIKAYDNTILKGTFIPSLDETSTNMAIVVHGYKAHSEDMIIIAQFYINLGFKVLLVNQRAHGPSEGKFASFGHYEKYDLKRWIDFCLRTYGATDQILLHGVSMGAASIMLTTSLRIPSNVRYLVLDSGFTSFLAMFSHYIKPKVLLAFFPGVSLITFMAHRFFLHQISPIKALRKNKIPFIIVHGKQDSMVPHFMAEELFQSSKAPYKDILSVDNCEHGLGYKVNRQLYEMKIKEALPQYFDIKKAFLKTKK